MHSILWGPNIRSWGWTRGNGAMLVCCVRLLYRLIAALARLAVRSGRSKDLEIIVLRHQLTVLRRQIDRSVLNDDDRTMLGAIVSALPRPPPNRLACHPRHPAAVAPPTHGPTLDPTDPRTGTAID